MSRDNQIEEMAKVLCEDYGECKKCTLSNPECENPCMISEDCERLYNAGYRKQSEPISWDHEKGGEWISVDERLPEEDVRVLVYINSGRSYTKLDTDRLSGGKWVRWYEDVTHWMPLPEPPKMKGGAE